MRGIREKGCTGEKRVQIHIFQTRKVGYVSENFHFLCCDLLHKRARFYRKELNAVPSKV